MVARKAWIPGCGTYSVEATSDVYNPTAGEVSLLSSQPKEVTSTDQDNEDERQLICPHDEAAAKSALRWYLNVASLANLATVEQSEYSSANPGQWEAKGAPTEIAIEVFAGRFGWNRLELTQGPKAEWEHVTEYPFDSDVKKMTVLFHNNKSNETHVFTKVGLDIHPFQCATNSCGFRGQ